MTHAIGSESPEIVYYTLKYPMPELDSQSKVFVRLLSQLALKKILDGGEGQQACKQIGQQIYDLFTQQAGGDSMAGQKALRSVCDATRIICRDGHQRKAFITSAWSGVGDKSWRWLG